MSIYLRRKRRSVRALVSKFNKKGLSLGYFEIIFVVVILFVIGVAWVVTSSAGSQINNAFLDEPGMLKENTTARSTLESLESRKDGFFDSAFALFFIGMFFLGGISAWFSGSNPVFFVVTLLLIVVALLIPAMLGDAWTDIAENFIESSNMRFISWIMSNYLLFMVVFVLFVLSVMFYKSRVDI